MATEETRHQTMGSDETIIAVHNLTKQYRLPDWSLSRSTALKAYPTVSRRHPLGQLGKILLSLERNGSLDWGAELLARTYM